MWTGVLDVQSRHLVDRTDKLQACATRSADIMDGVPPTGPRAKISVRWGPNPANDEDRIAPLCQQTLEAVGWKAVGTPGDEDGCGAWPHAQEQLTDLFGLGNL